MLVACGPYATSDSVAFDPLSDLLDVIARDRPDVCVLVRLQKITPKPLNCHQNAPKFP